jgi:hypothetical protein
VVGASSSAVAAPGEGLGDGSGGAPSPLSADVAGSGRTDAGAGEACPDVPFDVVLEPQAIRANAHEMAERDERMAVI